MAASKGVEIVQQRDALAGVALWRTAETHPQGPKREEGDGGYWLARFAVCPADFHFMARESQSPLGVHNPPPPTLPPTARTTSFYWSLWKCGRCPRFTMIHPCGDSLTVGLLHQYGHPNLLLDPTHLFPPYKNTTSLADMLLSPGFLRRCLKATVPTMTLSLHTEARQCRGPVGYFSMNEAGCRGK